jgi:hypothetical protein
MPGTLREDLHTFVTISLNSSCQRKVSDVVEKIKTHVSCQILFVPSRLRGNYEKIRRHVSEDWDLQGVLVRILLPVFRCMLFVMTVREKSLPIFSTNMTTPSTWIICIQPNRNETQSNRHNVCYPGLRL